MKFIFFFLSFIFFQFSYPQQLKVDSLSVTYKYLVHIPEVTNKQQKLPLLLYLHGAGSRGGNIESVQVNNPLNFYSDRKDFPFLLVAPQCPQGKTWNPDILINIIKELEIKYPIDTNREFVTGISMGGDGVWQLLKRAPDKFAGAIPICGSGDTTDMCLLKYVPVWAFHGKNDKTVPYSISTSLIDNLNKAGGMGTVTLYDSTRHDSWK